MSGGGIMFIMPVGGIIIGGTPPDCSAIRRSSTESLAAPAPHAPPITFSCFTGDGTGFVAPTGVSVE